jgi:C1A family cysteine protease
MLRIEHGLWSLRSEGDVGDSISLFFGAHGKCQGGTPAEVLDWIIKNGVADPGSWLYSQKSRVGSPTPDRLGRTAKIDGYHQLSGQNDMKQWIDLNGPIAACFDCYPEFDDACKNNEVYIYNNPQNLSGGGHCIVIVGYDDAKKAWLIRNS